VKQKRISGDGNAFVNLYRKKDTVGGPESVPERSKKKVVERDAIAGGLSQRPEGRKPRLHT